MNITEIRANARAAAAAAAGDWATVKDAMEQPKLVPDKTRYSLQEIGDRTSLRTRAMFAETFQKAIEAQVPGYAELIIAREAMGQGELELWQEDRQAVLDQLLPDAIKEEIKALGVKDETQHYTVEEYSVAWSDGLKAELIATTLAPISQEQGKASARLNNATASLAPGKTSGMTMEQLQERCRAVTASEDGTVR